MNEKIEILIDFDGTCVKHEFPKIGGDVGAQLVLKNLVNNGHKLILFTMRSDFNGKQYLTDAVNWFKENDIPLYGINKNPTQVSWTSSPKAYGQLIIDDISLGIPLKNDGKHEYVDWIKVEELLIKMGVLI